jgi:hypothetical protein
MRSSFEATAREVSWERLGSPRLSKKQPSADNVESLIHSLTAADPGTVIFTVANRHVLTIIGDEEQGFVVRISSSMASKQLFALAPADQQSGTVVLVVGAQREEYPRRIIVDKLTALRAARGFWQRGLPDETVHWTADAKSVR